MHPPRSNMISCGTLLHGDAKIFLRSQKQVVLCMCKLSTPKNSSSTHLLRYISLLSLHLFSLAVYFIVFHTIFYYYSCTFSLESDRYACGFKSKSERPPNREHIKYTRIALLVYLFPYLFNFRQEFSI